MKLKNNEEAFEMTYDGKDVKVPGGTFEVSNMDLGYFIHTTAMKWGKNVEIVDDGASLEIKQEIVSEEKEEIEDIKKEVKASIKEVEKEIKKSDKKK